MLPDFNEDGDLPIAVHRARLSEIVTRFGESSFQRRRIIEKLVRVFNVCRELPEFNRLVIYGSFVTTKENPRDIDLLLIMNDDFRIERCDQEAQRLFDHNEAEKEFGASIFWARPAMLLEPLEDFITHWRIKRDGTQRGIVEVIND